MLRRTAPPQARYCAPSPYIAILNLIVNSTIPKTHPPRMCRCQFGWCPCLSVDAARAHGRWRSRCFAAGLTCVQSHVHVRTCTFQCQRNMTLRQMPVVLPHELLHALDESKRLVQLCDQRDLADFWAHFHSNVSMHVQWQTQAPIGKLAVPIGLHGDDCRYTDTNQKIVILTMNVLVDKSQQRFPLFAIRHASKLHFQKA